MFCVSLCRVLSGCCLFVIFLGGGITFEVININVGSRESDRDNFYDYMYGYVVLRLN